MKGTYLHTVSCVQKLHRQLLEVVRTELDQLGLRDVNNVQCLLLFNIGDDDVTVGELTHRGYYLGTNVTYNLKKVVESGYALQERSQHDRRQVHVRLTEKGQDLCVKLDAIFERHAEALASGVLDVAALRDVNEALEKLSRFWGGGAFRVVATRAA